MSSFEATLAQLPRPILDKLQSIIWRVRRLLLVRGIFATVAIGLLSLLAIMAIDASVTIFSSAIRWALSITGLLVTVGAGWWFLIRPLSRRLSLTHVARILEVRHPELQERISTAVELLSSNDPEEIKGSEELIKAVVDSAVLDVQNVDPKREFKGGKAARFVKLAALCLSLLAVVLLVFPNHGWKLLTRAVAPFSNIGNAYADTMTVDPGDFRIAKGSEFTITMTVKHDKLRRAELRRLLESGTDSVERMTLMGKTDDGAQKFSITFPAVEESFEYRVRAGAALSRYFKVETVPPPVIEKRTIRYEYPEYTGLEPAEEESLNGEIKAVANTKVTVTSLVNKEVWKAQMVLNDAGELGDTNVDDRVVTTDFVLKNSTSGTWRLDLEDMDEFANERTPFPIQALPDRAPVVRIVNPMARELRLKPVEVLPIDYEVGEDFGFSEVAILVMPNDETNPRVIIQPEPTAAARPGTWKGKAPLNLASLDLKPGQNQLQVQIRALDNRPESFNGPGEGISETITIFIDRNAKSLAEQTIDAQKRDLTQAIREARSDLERAKSDIRNAERELARRDEISPNAERDLSRFREEAKQAEDVLKDIAEKLENSVFKPQIDALEEIAEEEIANAQEAADLIPVTDEKQERVAEAREALEQVEQALADLKDVENSVRDTEKDLEAIAQLNEMANDQRELAKDAAEQAAREMQTPAANEEQRRREQQQAMKEFQKRQEDVQQDLGEMLKDNAAALTEVLEKQQQEAQELADRADQLAEAQEDLRKMTTDAAQDHKNPEKQAALREEVMERLKQMQEQIAKETRQAQEASTKPESEPNAESPALAEAAEQTQSAAESLEKENMEGASEAAREAAESLAEAAEQSQPADQSEKTDQPNQSKNLGELAERQEAVAEQIAAVEAGDLQEALAQMEEQLAAESGDLQEQAESLEETLENLQQRQSRYEAAHASNFLRNAENQAQQAQRDLAQAQQAQDQAESKGQVPPGQMSPQAAQAMARSQQDQQQAQRSMETAAKSLQKATEAIGQTLDGLEPSESDERLADSEQMAESFDELTQSAQSQNSQEAADRSQQAAESLQQMAQQAMEQLGQMGQNPPPGEGQQPSQQQQQNQQMSQQQNEGSQPNNGEKMADADGRGIPPELAELGISAKDWARFKGALTGGSATAIDTNLPAEYRELVGRYFQVIAKEANGK